MRYVFVNILMIFAVLMVELGCTTTHAPRLTASQAIKLATAVATQKIGTTDMMRQYMSPTVCYRPESAKWVVHWDARPDQASMVLIGSDYWAYVDDVSGSVSVEGGL
jgi:hypothetical protein